MKVEKNEANAQQSGLPPAAQLPSIAPTVDGGSGINSKLPEDSKPVVSKPPTTTPAGASTPSPSSGQPVSTSCSSPFLKPPPRQDLRNFSYGVIQHATAAVRRHISPESEGSVMWTRSWLWDEEDQTAIFNAVTKANWLDTTKGYCTLCQEPVTNFGTHTGYWDHVCLHLFFRLCVRYPRNWSAEQILLSSLHQFPSVADYLTDVQFLGLKQFGDDRTRVAELRSLLMVLEAEPFGVLKHSPRGTLGIGMNNNGERYFREDVGRLCTALLPPMSAMNVTRFQQKCWGRQNLEEVFDLMDLNTWLISLGLEPKKEKNEKGELLRNVFSELHDGLWRLRFRHTASPSSLMVETDDEFGAEGVAGSLVQREVAVVLMDAALKRLAFELVYRKSLHYMTRVQEVIQRHHSPPFECIDRWQYH
jgi:hypothetical protein